MGTRHLIAVKSDGEYKVAQYGQWDGYPDGQGVAVLEFLRQYDLSEFKQRLLSVRFLDEVKDKEFVDSYNANVPKWSNEPDKRTTAQKRWWKLFQSRDLGAKVLSNILHADDNEIVLSNQLSFAADSLMCEYAYVIDFDINTFEVFQGFNKSPLSPEERFYNIDIPKDGAEYKQIKIVKAFDLDKLPTKEEFLSEFKNDEEELE